MCKDNSIDVVVPDNDSELVNGLLESPICLVFDENSVCVYASVLNSFAYYENMIFLRSILYFKYMWPSIFRRDGLIELSTSTRLSKPDGLKSSYLNRFIGLKIRDKAEFLRE